MENTAIQITDEFSGEADFDSAIPASAFQVSVGEFHGPLDLLLHLVKREEVPVEEVQMATIADQYLSIIENARSLDLEIATEFLVVAATLIAIKSEAVLPERRFGDDGALDDLSDPYGELRERLRRYELFRERAMTLRDKPQLGLDTYTRIDRSRSAPVPDQIDITEDIQSVGFMFVKLLKRIGESVSSIRIQLEPVSVVDCMMRMIDTLRSSFRTDVVDTGPAQPRSFYSLVQQQGKADSQRGVMIGSFIALLELVKRGVISVTQHGERADIDVTLKLTDDEEIEPESMSLEEDEDKVVPLNRSQVNQ